MIPFKEGQKILEVGGGAYPMCRPNLDVRPMPTVDLVGDLNEKWPVEDHSFEGVFSKYAMEHVSWRKVDHFAAELFRVLLPGGGVCLVIPNTRAQMEWALKQSDYGKVSQCLFGDQDYPENSHKTAFSPESVTDLLRKAGFDAVSVRPHGELGTDMIVEAWKPKAVQQPAAAAWSPEERKLAYNYLYFDGGRGAVGGYAREGYWDYPVHWNTYAHIMLRGPESVLEIGCAKGYVLRRVQAAGVRVQGMEVSKHCIDTRATDPILEHDMTVTPWPFKDQEFDLCVSMAVLEHIPPDKMEAVASEIRRVSKRGLHGVDFGDHDDGFDKTHCLFRDKAWWEKTLGPGQEVFEKDELEKDPGSQDPKRPIPFIQKSPTIFPEAPQAKANLGCNTIMFHHGWVNVDERDLAGFAQANRYQFKRANLLEGVPFPDGHLELAVASHVLEHFDYVHGAAFLADLCRAMKPGGIVRISVPDLEILTAAYRDGEISKFNELGDPVALAPSDAHRFWELLCKNHRSAYDTDSLIKAMSAAGFRRAGRVGFRESCSTTILRETLDSFPTLSIYMEAVK